MDFPHAVTSISLLVSVVQTASLNECSTARKPAWNQGNLAL